MTVNVTESEMACILALRHACFHNGHEHRELWRFGLRDILGRAIPLDTGPVEFQVVMDSPNRFPKPE